MKTYFAVFSNPDPDSVDVFWGAFPDKASADSAVAEWIETHPYWELEEFKIREFDFGVLL